MTVEAAGITIQRTGNGPPLMKAATLALSDKPIRKDCQYTVFDAKKYMMLLALPFLQSQKDVNINSKGVRMRTYQLSRRARAQGIPLR